MIVRITYLLFVVDAFFSVSIRHRRNLPSRSSISRTGVFSNSGLYRPIAESTWNRLRESFPFLIPVEYDSSLRFNEAPAKGNNNAIVRIETRALAPRDASENSCCPIRYARMALLETITTNSTEASVHSSGIQVLNMVVFPDASSVWPVWSCDFVSLPGNKHVLLLDAQPMSESITWSLKWKDWYEKHDISSTFPWGGDIPERVLPYISEYALWTRFASEVANPLDRIKGPLTEAVRDHFDMYAQLLTSKILSGANRQAEYVQYRLENDPARPVLNSLYGKNWTEQVLEQVLFPH